MAQLAIKGHKTRDNEVIEILEMLGGENEEGLWGDNPNVAYYICDDNIIRCDWRINGYTLEEFLEKFPYKVGDKVFYHECKAHITSMKWDGREIIYTVECNKELWETTVFFLQPYKEETMEAITIDDFKANTKEWLIDKLHDMVISKAIKTIGDIHEELHKPQYPKTYDECVGMFNGTVETVNLATLKVLRELIYCRNAYWKIAGEQMGLGKPWEPEYPSEHYIFTIENQGNNIIKNAICDRWRNRLLIFPTEEIRDMFYENFKEMIEMCKDFL